MLFEIKENLANILFFRFSPLFFKYLNTSTKNRAYYQQKIQVHKCLLSVIIGQKLQISNFYAFIGTIL